MYLIEQMLTGQMKMSDFIILLKSDKSLQEIIRGFVPQEAIGNRSHAFWKEMSYDALLERNFNFLRLVTDLARFDGTIRDNLNIFYNIRCAYLYYKPDLCCTNKYFDAHDRLVELHVTEKSDAKTTKETLKWVHIAISNAKRTLLGNYHKIKRKYLQLYLNEFIYKLNRRYFGDKLFDRLVIANITGA